MCANDDAYRGSFAGGAPPRDDARYGAFDLEADSTVIYDVENDAAWIQSDVVSPLSARR
jgi:hypothetical protein